MKIKNAANETMKGGCLVLDTDGRMLIVTNPKRTKWGFPKGHAELGETTEQAAIRETLEETGYTVRVIRQLPDLAYPHGKTDELIRVSMYLAEPVEQIQEPEPGEIVEWVTIEEAKKRMYPNVAPYLDRLNLQVP
jgi:8-oxo-dGTP pyrophosphatase MutT (NUDIX family)